ncbi:unnamed protein product [Eruca vesicaria subsp. sativa]|uniref:Uncharacterized protein n=1 Tax=Eruca vesicaria subsp. sativa TaxID=29727 RepID=A0ABC8MAA1_ERUVS|nr:unnamed protein product [Eruca vesicaria subsp. sativa]
MLSEPRALLFRFFSLIQNLFWAYLDSSLSHFIFILISSSIRPQILRFNSNAEDLCKRSQSEFHSGEFSSASRSFDSISSSRFSSRSKLQSSIRISLISHKLSGIGIS